MRKYESIVVFCLQNSETIVRGLIDRIKTLIGATGGHDLNIQEWGIRELAYPIRKHQRGVYVNFQFTSTPLTVSELNRTLKITDEVLRFATLLAPNIQPKYKAVGSVEPGSMTAAPETFIEEN